MLLVGNVWSSRLLNGLPVTVDMMGRTEQIYITKQYIHLIIQWSFIFIYWVPSLVVDVETAPFPVRVRYNVLPKL